MIERIARAHGNRVQQIEQAIDLVRFDVTRFRVDNDTLGEQSIPLEAGATVITSAFGMIRAAATTARRPRQSIGGNYSKLGDGLAREARLGHTEVGSFVFPVLMRVGEPIADPVPALPSSMFDAVRPESQERRVFRTLAQTLLLFERHIIQSGREPRLRDLTPVIIAGGSKEIFAQMSRALAEPSVSWLETRFDWAASEMIAENTPERVIIPAEARYLVDTTVKLLSTPQREPLLVVTGPIIHISHAPGDPFGEIAIQAPSQNGSRNGRIEVRVHAAELTQLHHWMDTATTVVVQGVVERRPGHVARLRKIASPKELSETLTGL
ncbi:hypothetical protein [Cryobacterium sp. W22_MBD10_FK3]|uniref:hypothetical protein n=1 Tax=Cryobacterium sp. W22_MBD10_FK3 TaxID=3240273 RepID=UPI003F8F9372